MNESAVAGPAEITSPHSPQILHRRRCNNAQPNKTAEIQKKMKSYNSIKAKKANRQSLFTHLVSKANNRFIRLGFCLISKE
jgi:hypothetical protein